MAAGIDYAPGPPGGEGSAQHLKAQIEEHQSELDRLLGLLTEKEKEDEQARLADGGGESAVGVGAEPDNGEGVGADKRGADDAGAQSDHGKGVGAHKPHGKPKHQ